jgi:4-diphosphocytidyl-2-C-methyl-D-erythritol kinase
MNDPKPQVSSEPLDEIWPAPAKLNLFIHVLGRRDDGYHDIQTVFQFLDFGDRLSFDSSANGRIHRPAGAVGVSEDEDLVTNAARLLQRETGCREGASIRVDKRLPMQAGLGGGSSDAATTLHALNHLWSLKLGTAELAELGGRLGADVPVFVAGVAAWAEGRGDRLQPVELPEPWFLVVRPPCEVSTADIYGAPELARNSGPIDLEAYLAGAGRNDFEPVVCARHPEVAEALRWLACYGESRLTGTGACVFAAFEDEHAARAAHDRVPDGWQAFVARGRSRSPLLDRVERVRKQTGARSS